MYCYLKLDPAEMWFFQSFWAEVTTLLSCVLQNDENNNPALEETGEGRDLMESRLKKPHLEKVRRTRKYEELVCLREFQTGSMFYKICLN